MIGYLDIETTGLSRTYHDITVIGIALENGSKCEVIQLFNADLHPEKLQRALKGVTSLYTYNGKRFDLPFIRSKFQIDVAEICCHTDLMYDCWKKNLKGGLKVVERTLGIPRKLSDMDGFAAVGLWWDYKRKGNQDALTTLLEYNQEDILRFF